MQDHISEDGSHDNRGVKSGLGCAPNEANDLAWAKLVKLAWQDDTIRVALLENPVATLTKYGVTVPKNISVTVVQNTKDVFHVIVPSKPDLGIMTESEILTAAGCAATTLSHC
jgi:hypothetical protein